jgi:Aminoglycoside-2''-adenylyltransferase
VPASIVAPFGPWEPAQPSEAAAIFAAMPCPWWIAGGFAIELAIGRPVRTHADIDVLVLRQDHLRVQQALHGWEWWAADPPGTLRPWLPHEQLPAAVHDIWCRPGPADPWRIQVMIDESSDGDWVSRRNPSIRRPMSMSVPVMSVVDLLGGVGDESSDVGSRREWREEVHPKVEAGQGRFPGSAPACLTRMSHATSVRHRL